MYEKILEDRGVTGITQYATRVMRNLNKGDREHLSVTSKYWTTGDRLYKLAAEYYGTPQYWWVIARFNNKPTDAHFKLGDTVYIPMPRETILDMYGV